LSELLIREATPDDAAGVLAQLKGVLSDEPVMIPKQPEEVTLSLTQLADFLGELAASPTSLFLIALADDQIVANLDLIGLKRQSMAHVAQLGIGILAPWRGQGLGRRLMQTAIDWARPHPTLQRIELNVYADNLPAIALYEKFGFMLEGRRRGMVWHQGCLSRRSDHGPLAQGLGF
jgi:RimJ/RimL family protein N-acetyltransferase